MKTAGYKTLVKDGMYNAFPSIVRAKNGSLVMVFRQADNSLEKYGVVSHVDPSSRVVMMTSDDDGNSWGAVKTIYNDEMGEQDPCLTCLKDGTLICTFFRWKVVPKEDSEVLGEAYKHYGRIIFDRWAAVHVGTVCIRSRDNGETWEGPFNITPDGYQGPAALRGNIVELADGRLLAPLYAVKKFGDLSSCIIMGTEDQGETWYNIGEVPGLPDLHFVEPFLYPAPSGRLDMLLRTHRDFLKMPFDQTYMHLHLSSSGDGGKSWSTPVPTELFCPNPVHVLPVKDENVLVTYGQRRDPKGIEGFLTNAEHPEFRDADTKSIKPAESGDLGYTSAVQLNDGSVLIVYYMTDPDAGTCIGATWLEV